MASKKTMVVDLDELEGMEFDDLMNRFEVDEFGITDEMAVDSEKEGDSDADDSLPLRVPRSSTSPRRRSTRVNEGASCSGLDSSTTETSNTCSSAEVEDEIDLSDIAEENPQPRARIDLEGCEDEDESEGLPMRNLADSEVEELLEEEEEQPSTKRRRLKTTETPFKWSQFEDEHHAIKKKYEDSPFAQPYGPSPQVQFDKFSSIFGFFFNVQLITWIVDQSNLYAEQKGASLGLTAEELSAFFGCLIIMGINHLPSMKLYWSTDPAVGNRRISSVFSCRRFLNILRYLHLNDNSKFPARGSPDYDKLFKIRVLHTHLRKKFKEAFNPGRFLSIDESMIPFKGRSTLKQYMPLKPIKRGFKVWALACATSGYLVAFDLYAGKATTARPSGTSLGSEVVMSLCQGFEFLNFCLFFDRFFSSLPLIVDLLKKGFFACATILSSRKWFPSNLLASDKNLRFSESSFVSAKEFGVVKWKDRGSKAVCVVSSMNEPSAIETAQRKNAQGQKVEVPCPASVKNYNAHMGGVDVFDQYMSYYSLQWKSRRWWMKAFYYFLDAAIVNSYILYKEKTKMSNAEALERTIERKKKPTDDCGSSGEASDSEGSDEEYTVRKKSKKKKKIKQTGVKAASHLQFRLALAEQLLGNFVGRKDTGKDTMKITKNKHSALGRMRHENPIRAIAHLPQKCKPRRCAHCSSRKKVVRSSLECQTCGVALCAFSCYKTFHESTPM